MASFFENFNGIASGSISSPQVYSGSGFSVSIAHASGLYGVDGGGGDMWLTTELQGGTMTLTFSGTTVKRITIAIFTTDVSGTEDHGDLIRYRYNGGSYTTLSSGPDHNDFVDVSDAGGISTFDIDMSLAGGYWITINDMTVYDSIGVPAVTGPERIIKNATYTLKFVNIDTDGAVLGSPSGFASTISKDQAAAASTSGSASEVIATSGMCALSLTATEMSGDHMDVFITQSTSGALTPRAFTLIPEAAIDSGVAQAGAASTITLRASASSTNDYYVGYIIEPVRGTGSAQKARYITAYNGTSKVATVQPAWDTQPDNTTVYKIFEPEFGLIDLVKFWNAAIREATVSSSTDTVISTDLTGLGDDALKTAAVMVMRASDGSLRGRVKKCTAYDSSAGDITIEEAFASNLVSGDKILVFGIIG